MWKVDLVDVLCCTRSFSKMFFFSGGKNGAKYARQQYFGLGCLIEKACVWGTNFDMGDDNNNTEAAALRLSSDFKLKECPAFIGSTGREGKGPKVWAFNDSDIPLAISGFNDKKQVSVGLVVVDCSMGGYTRVPYECTSGDRYKVSFFFVVFFSQSKLTMRAHSSGREERAAPV